MRETPSGRSVAVWQMSTSLVFAVFLALLACTADAALSSWQSAPAMPAARVHSGAVATGHYFYVAGGCTGQNQGPTATFWRFNPAVGTWAAMTHLPKRRCDPAAVSVPDGRVFIIGGFTGGLLHDEQRVWAYSPKSNTWKARAMVPRAPAGGQDAVTAGTTIRRVYVIGFGGPDFQGVIIPAHLYRYNQRTDVWSTLTTTLPHPRWEPSTAAIGGDIYVFGGAMGTNGIGTPKASAWRYRISTGKWKTLHSMPVAERGAVAVVGNDGLIYVIGGGDDPRIQVGDDRVQIYNPVTDTWAMGASLTVPRAAAAAGRIGSVMYVAGGGDYPGFSEILSSVDTATITP